MLVDPRVLLTAFQHFGIQIKGILHVGAHLCEEKEVYNTIWNVKDENILWVDANETLIAQNTQRGIPNCYTAVLDDKERECEFNITNNGQSSSILELGTHQQSYPDIVVVEKRSVKTQTLKTFFQKNKLDIRHYNVWNFDIQGVEYQVFNGSPELLNYADAIYTEINTDDVYKGCGKVDEIDALLQKYGLQRVLTHMTGAQWGDALYVRVAPAKPSFGTMTLAIPTYRRFKPFLEVYLPKYLALSKVDEILIADETGEDIDQIKAQPWGSHPKLRFIRNPERLGAYHNKLNMMKQITTDWVALIDSDNEVVQEYFDALHSYWSDHGENPKQIYIPAGIESRDISSIQTTKQLAHLAGFIVNKSNWNMFLHYPNAGYCLNLGNCVFHKSAIQDIPETIPKDVMADCQVMNKHLVEKEYELVLVPNMRYFHVVHPGSLYLTTMQEQQKFHRETNWNINS